MDQKTTRLNFPLRDIKGLWLLLFCVVLTAVPSCKDDDDLLRKDFLIVSDSLTREPVSAINCRVEEGRDTLYVHANVPYEMFSRLRTRSPTGSRMKTRASMPRLKPI